MSEAGNAPYVKSGSALAQALAGVGIIDATRTAQDVLERLAAAGYHVVQEGQAVVDGRVWNVETQIGSLLVRLRPLTQPPPVVDEEA